MKPTAKIKRLSREYGLIAATVKTETRDMLIYRTGKELLEMVERGKIVRVVFDPRNKS